jgi:hypothetical protein
MVKSHSMAVALRVWVRRANARSLARPLASKLLRHLVNLKVWQGWQVWTEMVKVERTVERHYGLAAKSRGIAALFAFLKKRRQMRRLRHHVNERMKDFRRYGFLHLLHHLVLFRRQRHILRLMKCRFGLRRLAEFAHAEQDRKRKITRIDNARVQYTLNYKVRHLLLAKRERQKEQRARHKWQASRHRRFLLWGLQGLEIQVGRRWALREKQATGVDLWRHKQLLAKGLRCLRTARRERSLIDATWKGV